MPLSAAATFAAIAVGICAGGTLHVEIPYVVNPTGMLSSWNHIFLIILGVAVGGELINHLLHFLLTRVLRVSPLVTAGARGRLEAFAPVDFIVIACNMFTHVIIMSHLFAIILQTDVERRLGSFTIVNGPVAFVATVMLNDLMYWAGHGAMHLKSLYPYVHKQHHRQLIPFRGLPDALNIHPAEELIGAAIFGAALQVAIRTIGVHASTAWVSFAYWSLFNILNHFDLDTPLRVPVPFASGALDHQMHHRVPRCNYSKLTMFWDRLFGTYRPFVEVSANIAPTGYDKGPRFPLSEALPSAWCVLVLVPFFLIAGGLVEAIRTTAVPVTSDLLQMVPAFAVVAFVSMLCAVHGKTYRTPKIEKKVE
jgi:sterol desaturase/sphingolipid hydroxylase (fatty acid hydroxylase superfamily)